VGAGIGKCFFNLAFYLISSLLIACFCLFSGFFGVYCFIVLLFYCLRKRKEKVISLIKGVKKLRLLTTSILTKIEKAPTPLNS
ncbi:hypothetical protein, partial [Helicobacter pylori]|uniref:hypothetical protein n=1 Tax=Helicobacter pylori TaxID=210 RepID=UPI0011C42C31